MTLATASSLEAGPCEDGGWECCADFARASGVGLVFWCNADVCLGAVPPRHSTALKDAEEHACDHESLETPHEGGTERDQAKAADEEGQVETGADALEDDIAGHLDKRIDDVEHGQSPVDAHAHIRVHGSSPIRVCDGVAYPRSDEDSIIPPQALSLEQTTIDAQRQEQGGNGPQRPDAGEEFRSRIVVREGGQVPRASGRRVNS